MTTEAEAAAGRKAARVATAKRQRARAAMREVSFDALAAGWSIEQIAELRKVHPRTVRREVDRALSERRLDAPDRYAHLQVAGLTKALRVADAALDEGDLKAIDPMLKVVRELNRCHGGAPGRLATAASATPTLPAPLLCLTASAEPLAQAFASLATFLSGWEGSSHPPAGLPGPSESGQGVGADPPMRLEAVAPVEPGLRFVTGFRPQPADPSARRPDTRPGGQGVYGEAAAGAASEGTPGRSAFVETEPASESETDIRARVVCGDAVPGRATADANPTALANAESKADRVARNGAQAAENTAGLPELQTEGQSAAGAAASRAPPSAGVLPFPVLGSAS